MGCLGVSRPTEPTYRWILLNWRSSVVKKTNGIVTEGMFLWTQARLPWNILKGTRGRAYGLCY